MLAEINLSKMEYENNYNNDQRGNRNRGGGRGRGGKSNRGRGGQKQEQWKKQEEVKAVKVVAPKIEMDANDWMSMFAG